MTPLDLPLYDLADDMIEGVGVSAADSGTLSSYTESIEKLAGEPEPAGTNGSHTVSVAVAATRLADLVASRPQDTLTARLLKARPALAELRVQVALSAAQLAAVTLAGSRPLVVTLQLQDNGQTEITEAECGCEHEITCGEHTRQLRAAAIADSLHVVVERSQQRLGGWLLRRLLATPRLLQLRLAGWRDLRIWHEAGGDFAAVRQLAIVSRSACCDVHALAQLFPELRQLSLTREAERRDERCMCRFRSTTLLPRLETVKLENVCPTATAAIRAYAKSLHTLRLKSCSLTSPSSEYLNRAAEYQARVAQASAGGRSFRDIIQAILRRKLITLPNIQIRRLHVTDSVVDVALLNRNFPCLKALSVECGELTADTAKNSSAAEADAPPLWFPCLERLQLRLSGPDQSQEPCILTRPLPRLAEYTQSFGAVRLSRLSVCCPQLERLSLDPVLLNDTAGQLPHLLQLTVSWCDADTLREAAAAMPALRHVRVLEPPYLDKAGWQPLQQQLAQRRVQVALEW